MKVNSKRETIRAGLGSAGHETASDPGDGLKDAPIGDVLPVIEQRHFSVQELAKLWHLSVDAIRRIFEKEPGVLVLSDVKRGKRRYRTIRIPESVAQRVHGKMSLSGP